MTILTTTMTVAIMLIKMTMMTMMTTPEDTQTSGCNRCHRREGGREFTARVARDSQFLPLLNTCPRATPDSKSCDKTDGLYLKMAALLEITLAMQRFILRGFQDKVRPFGQAHLPLTMRQVLLLICDLSTCCPFALVKVAIYNMAVFALDCSLTESSAPWDVRNLRQSFGTSTSYDNAFAYLKAFIGQFRGQCIHITK